MKHRFQDQNKRITEFDTEVWVECPRCGKKAVAQADYAERKARLLCTACHYNKELSTPTEIMGMQVNSRRSADAYFEAKIWFQHPFKNDTFWVYNPANNAPISRYLRNYPNFITMLKTENRC